MNNCWNVKQKRPLPQEKEPYNLDGAEDEIFYRSPLAVAFFSTF